MIETSIMKAQLGEGVFFQIIVNDQHLSSFHSFEFSDDPMHDAENIAQSIQTELMKFFIENGFFTSADNKSILGKL